MAEKIVEVKTLLEEGAMYYFKMYKEQPTKAGIGPGRVNLIGEHVDYNDGYVLPMVIFMFIYLPINILYTTTTTAEVKLVPLGWSTFLFKLKIQAPFYILNPIFTSIT
jgi:hypothetical protein